MRFCTAFLVRFCNAFLQCVFSAFLHCVFPVYSLCWPLKTHLRAKSVSDATKVILNTLKTHCQIAL
jgi:hypothetical protein